MGNRTQAALAELSLLLVACIVIAIYPSIYSWDVVPYVAIADSYFTSDPATLHAETFTALREAVPPSAFQDLTTANSYQAGVFESPDDLVKQLPFYRAKPLYPLLMAGLHAAGLNLVTAGIVVSKLSVILALLVAHAWFSGLAAGAVSRVLAPLVFLSPPVLGFSGWITPDPLFCLVFLAFVFLVVARENPVWSVVLWPVMVLCRPDSIIFITLDAAYLLYMQRRRLPIAAVFALVIVQYVVQLQVSENYGWSTLFYHSFVAYQLDPASLPTQLGLDQYLKIYRRNFFSVDTLSMLWWLLLALVLARYCLRNARHSNRIAHIIILIVLFSALHWMAFPAEKSRLLFSSYLSFVLLAGAIFFGGTRDGGNQTALPKPDR